MKDPELKSACEMISELDEKLAARDFDRASWPHDLGSVVGGVLLAAGLIAAIVWGIYG